MSKAAEIIDLAKRRAAAREAARPRIDYERMKRVRHGQKAALTHAINSKDAERVITVCRDAVKEWDEIGAWPDDWSVWQRALNDVLPWNRPVELEDLR